MTEDQKAKLIAVVKAASERWKGAFNSGNAKGCAALYEDNAFMAALPMGEFRGRSNIEQFWETLIQDGYSDVEYHDVQIDVINENTVILSASWKMNKASGVISKELWIIQDNGEALLRQDRFEVQG